MKSHSLFSLIFVATFLFTCSIEKNEEYYLAKAHEIHKEVLTIDTHTDTPYMFLKDGWNLAERHEFNNKERSRVDIPRMQEGGLDAVFFAAFVGQRKRTPENYKWATNLADSLVSAIKNVCSENFETIALAITPDEAYKNEKNGKISIYIGLENGSPIGKDISLLEKYYDEGVRYVTLCHTKNNDICDSSNDGPEHDGLSNFGKKVVKEMNRLGLIVDISHVSDKSFYDVIKLSKTPVVASHSCARAVCDNPRNMDDEMLKKLAENGGVMQMCILSDYVKKPVENKLRDSALDDLKNKFGPWGEIEDEETREKYRQVYYAIWEKYPKDLATVKDIADHIDHVVKLVGIEHIGIGTDFDGGGGVADCKDMSQLPNITAELLKRGYNKKELEKLWGGNFMRVFNHVESVAHN
jgi:membrane dipeptidase